MEDPLYYTNHPWAVFLKARMDLIRYMTTQGKNDGTIADSLSMDATQVWYIKKYDMELEKDDS
jgi:hypothetical protein